MPVDLSIPDDDIRNLNSQARQELHSCVQRYSTELLREANRFEAAQKTTSGDPEVTSSHVRDADIFLRRGLSSSLSN